MFLLLVLVFILFCLLPFVFFFSSDFCLNLYQFYISHLHFFFLLPTSNSSFVFWLPSALILVQKCIFSLSWIAVLLHHSLSILKLMVCTRNSCALVLQNFCLEMEDTLLDIFLGSFVYFVTKCLIQIHFNKAGEMYEYNDQKLIKALTMAKFENTTSAGDSFLILFGATMEQAFCSANNTGYNVFSFLNRAQESVRRSSSTLSKQNSLLQSPYLWYQ